MNQACYRLDLAKRHAEAAGEAQQAVELFRGLVKDHPDNREYEAALANTANTLGTELRRADKIEDSIRAYQESLIIQRKVLKAAPGRTESRALFGTTTRNLAIALRSKDSLAEARAAYRQAHEVFEALVADFPNVPAFHNELAETLKGEFLTLAPSEVKSEGRLLVEWAVQHARKAQHLDGASPTYRYNLCGCLFHWGKLLADQGDHRRAYEAAVDMSRYGRQGQDHLMATRLMAACIPLAEADGSLTTEDRHQLTEMYGAKAVAILREQVGQGSIPRQFLPEGDYLLLRSRADFQGLLKEAPRQAP